ncbi:hypothetical protein B0H14DRAFT_3630992 [Mycena olivaceomarginata]|nr:hypothetical protein B0H14DRAFT_3630992 [Mycena olivaceomarginata]
MHVGGAIFVFCHPPSKVGQYLQPRNLDNIGHGTNWANAFSKSLQAAWNLDTTLEIAPLLPDCDSLILPLKEAGALPRSMFSLARRAFLFYRVRHWSLEYSVVLAKAGRRLQHSALVGFAEWPQFGSNNIKSDSGRRQRRPHSTAPSIVPHVGVPRTLSYFLRSSQGVVREQTPSMYTLDSIRCFALLCSTSTARISITAPFPHDRLEQL